MFKILCFALLFLLMACAERTPTIPADVATASADAPTEMVLIPGGKFVMGSASSYAEAHEGPEIKVIVDSFYIDKTEVTNAAYALFAEATAYVTIAERPVDWELIKLDLPQGTPKPHDSLLAPGSLVFVPPSGPVSLDNIENWWQWTTGASWRAPEGPGSDLEGRSDHPVVHIAYEDAEAYAKWAGKRLPTEAEWEYASRAHGENSQFQWGEELSPDGKYLANFFQGQFPYNNLLADGYARTAPVGSFAPNEHGLYDMIGNVWEWTADLYRPDTKKMYAAMDMKGCRNPRGPEQSFDPNDPYATEKRVTKGGSFLCSAEYCSNYRPTSRMATNYDSGQSHLGFRCVKDVVKQ